MFKLPLTSLLLFVLSASAQSASGQNERIYYYCHSLEVDPELNQTDYFSSILMYYLSDRASWSTVDSQFIAAARKRYDVRIASASCSNSADRNYLANQLRDEKTESSKYAKIREVPM